MRTRYTPWLALAALGILPPAGAGGESREPFQIETLRVEGRATSVVVVPTTQSAAPLVVAHVAGVPPEDARRLSVFLPEGRHSYAGKAERVWEVPKQVVGFDIDPGAGNQAWRIVLLESRALRVLDPGADRPARTVTLEKPAPLPGRTWDLEHLTLLFPLAPGGGRVALVPTVDGAELVSLDGGTRLKLPLPVLADYEGSPSGRNSWDVGLTARLAWPSLELADDDGDGNLDLFACFRFGAVVFRGGSDGLAEAPSRSASFRPFPLEDELRHQATAVRILPQDVDGDGRAELIVQRNSGTLLGSHASTEVYRNRGSGAALSGPPVARLVVDHGLASILAEDLDGDGRVELVQTRLGFGVVQLMRWLLTRRAEVQLRVLRFRPSGNALEETWGEDLSLALDLGRGRVRGILPTVQGDWNGDGRHDLLYGDGEDRIAIRLGEPGARGPAFGARAVGQTIPAADRSLVQDLDGDGLDDLVLWDSRDPSGVVHLLHNRGLLPGTRAQLEGG